MLRRVTPPGNPDSVWRAHLQALPRVRSVEVLRRLAPGVDAPRVLVLSAHPDDETLGGGRLIADWVRAGAVVHAAVATAGEACFDVVGHVEQGLADTRLREWQRALDVLGVRAAGCFGLPDGGLADHADPLRAAVDALIDALAPDIVAGTHPADPHPDHAAVGRVLETVAADRALAAVAWPVWLTYFARPPGPAELQVVDCAESAERLREEAWRCFTSQREPIAGDITAVVPPEMTALLREQLLATVGPGAPRHPPRHPPRDAARPAG